jgi:tRNA nucleotidyltransferase (CCA-adding enzyme)
MSCTGSFKIAGRILGEPAGVPADVALDAACSPASLATIRRLQAAGYRAVVVGGAVRDALRGEEPHDFDVATSARPGEVRAVFGEAVYAMGGEEYGTVLVAALPGEGPVEATTFRRDLAADGRRTVVAFADDLLTDLERRDLTVNALAYDPVAGRLYGPGPGGDPAGALADLARGARRLAASSATAASALPKTACGRCGRCASPSNWAASWTKPP